MEKDLEQLQPVVNWEARAAERRKRFDEWLEGPKSNVCDEECKRQATEKYADVDPASHEGSIKLIADLITLAELQQKNPGQLVRELLIEGVHRAIHQ